MKFLTPISIIDATNTTWQFDKLENLTSFIKTEIKYWSEQAKQLRDTDGVDNPYLNAYTPLQAILDNIQSWKPLIPTWDDATFTTHFNGLQGAHLATLNTKWIWSGHPFISAWLNSYKYSQGTGEAFIQATLTKSIPHTANFDWLKGYLLAYEFELQDESNITRRRDAEEESFNHLRSVLVEQKDSLVSEISGFKADAENIKKTFTDFMRLEGPAEYWKIRADNCKKQGKRWAWLLAATIVVAGTIFVLLMAAWLHAYNTDLKLNTLEGAVIFAAILSLFAFAIKTLSKLTFSAFHLQRDAEEREQLTHLYLALSNDNKVDAESRNIVLQALFSRSDSGLLAGDHSPTMPISTLQDAIKAAGK